MAASKLARYLKNGGEVGQAFRGHYSCDTVCERLFKKYLGGVIFQVKINLKGWYDLCGIEMSFEKCKSSLEKNYS